MLRPTASIDAAGFTIQTAYDVYSRVTSVTDAKNNVTTFGNDRLGRSFRETKGTDSRTKTLDAAGNARQLTDRNGRVTAYEYDTLQRPTREAWKNGSNQDIRELVYGYDWVGNLTTVADNHINPASGVRTQASDTMAFTYMTRDQLDFESHCHLLVGRNVSFNDNYDANQKITPVPFGRPKKLSPTTISLINFPDIASHILATPSLPPVSKRVPSRLESTATVCFESRCTWWCSSAMPVGSPMLTSNTLANGCEVPAINFVPSGLKAK